MDKENFNALDERYTTAMDAAHRFLTETDYKVIKQAEGVEAMTDELKAKRQEARDTINEMSAKLEELWEQKAEWEAEHPQEEEIN